MKHKPVLFDKLTNSRHGSGREVIGLIGTNRGAGVTYTGLMLAFYMGEEMGKKTAYLECNEQHDMSLIQEAYEWSGVKTNCFTFHRVTCYKEVSLSSISGIYSEDFECIIMDFGIDFSRYREEFLRCTTKIVIAGRAQWNLRRLKTFSDQVQSIPGNSTWLYFIPQATDDIIRSIKNNILQKVYAVPQIEEPTMPSKLINRFFSKIF